MAYSKPEPLRGKHCCDEFSSGEDALDLWLKRYARHAESADSARTFVTTVDGSRVAGFYALTVGEVVSEDATERMLKGQPRGRSVPVAILARLAVDREHQGQRVGTSLLQDALLRVAGIAEEVGVRALVVHAMTASARVWYERFGFEPSPTDPLHLVLLMKELRKYLGEHA